MNWHFYIDSPQQRALHLCKGSLDRGGGKGVGRYGYVDGGGESDGSEQGYGNGAGGGWGFGYSTGHGDGWGGGDGGGYGEDGADGRSENEW